MTNLDDVYRDLKNTFDGLTSYYYSINDKNIKKKIRILKIRILEILHKIEEMRDKLYIVNEK